MKKAIYLSILALITVGCIIWRVGVDAFGWFSAHDTILNETQNMNMTDGAETLDAFSGLNVETDTMDVTVQQGKEYGISYEVAEKDAFQYSLENGTLTITQKHPKHWIGGVYMRSAQVTVTVPDDAKLDDVDITASVGDVSVRGIITENFFCELDTGDFTAENARLGDSTINADVGNVTLKKVLTKDLNVTSDVGDVDASLAGAEKDYNVTLEADVGNATLNGEHVRKSTRMDAPDADFDIDISADVGDIALTFAE